MAKRKEVFDEWPKGRRSESLKKVVAQKNQYARFVEVARELGCEEDEAAFEKRLRKIAKAPPPKPAKKKPRQTGGTGRGS
jgi:hypothetical protein